MPEEQKQYTTTLKIAGNISPELLKGIKTLIGHNASVVKQAADIGKESKKGFEEMKRGAEGAKEAVATLKEAISELILPIASAVAGFESVKGVFGVLDSASDKFREIRNSAASFRATLASTDWVSSHPGQLEAQFKFFEEQQERAVAANKDLFGGHLFEEIQGQLVSKAGLGSLLTEQITKALPSALARMRGGLDQVTAESATEMSGDIAQSIVSGRANRGLLGFNQGQVKQFRAANEEQRVNMILSSRYFRDWQNYLKEQQKANPEEFRLLQLRHENAVHQVALGKAWLGINEQVQGLAVKTQTALYDVLSEAVEPMKPYLENALQAASVGIEHVGSYFKWLFSDPKEFGHKLEQSLTDAMGAARKELDQMGFGGLVTAVEGLHHALGDSFKNDVAVLVAAFAGVKALSLAGNVAGWLQKVGLMTVNAGVVNVNSAGGGAGGLGRGALGGILPWLPTVGAAVVGAVAAQNWFAPTAEQNKAAGDNITKLHESQAQWKAQLQANADAHAAQSEAVRAVTGTLFPLDNAQQIQLQTINELNGALMAFNKTLQSIGRGSGGGGGGSMQPLTEYGPAVDYVDAQGRVHGTPDSDSSKGIGHIYGQVHHLTSGISAAMHPDYATQHYHIQPGQWYKSDKDGRWHRWDDTTGAANPENEDMYRAFATGGIVTGPTRAILGEGGSDEAVLPLNRNSLAKAGIGGGGFSPTFNLSLTVNGGGDEDFAYRVADVVRQRFEELQADAWHEYSRKQLS